MGCKYMMQAARDRQVGKRQKSNPTDSKAQHRLKIHTEENQAEVFPSVDSQPPETIPTWQGVSAATTKNRKDLLRKQFYFIFYSVKSNSTLESSLFFLTTKATFDYYVSTVFAVGLKSSL